MPHRFWLFLIGAAGLLVVLGDVNERLDPPRVAPVALDIRPGLRRLAVAVDAWDKRHGHPPPDRAAFDAEFPTEPGAPDLWTCPRCGAPFALGKGKHRPLRPATWPFAAESADPDPDAPAAFCLRCCYSDGTTDVLTFDGRIGSMPRKELLQKFVVAETGQTPGR
ncbi:MAG: hypothetical protein K8T20_09910 [Planctomycetes bacterium]|nr:hypothetical protein [Planctomycetota bacterium]